MIGRQPRDSPHLSRVLESFRDENGRESRRHARPSRLAVTVEPDVYCNNAMVGIRQWLAPIAASSTFSSPTGIHFSGGNSGSSANGRHPTANVAPESIAIARNGPPAPHAWEVHTASWCLPANKQPKIATTYSNPGSANDCGLAYQPRRFPAAEPQGRELAPPVERRLCAFRRPRSTGTHMHTCLGRDGLGTAESQRMFAYVGVCSIIPGGC